MLILMKGITHHRHLLNLKSNRNEMLILKEGIRNSRGKGKHRRMIVATEAFFLESELSVIFFKGHVWRLKGVIRFASSAAARLDFRYAVSSINRKSFIRAGALFRRSRQTANHTGG